MRSARFGAACPLLPESESQPPKCVPSLRATYGLMRSSENYMRDWQQDGIVFAHAHMSGASCCQRLIRPAIAAPRMGASQNSQSCAM